jgi:WD40 repeat protein
MSNLFISHSSRDNQAAKDLQGRLAGKGHRSVFLDLDPEAGIQAGVSWERTLYTKLRACRAVVALCSDSYLRSQWCFAEIALARMEGKEIFALQIEPWSEGTEMPSILTEDQFIDLRTNAEVGYRRLWNGFKVKGIVPAEQRDWRPNDPPYPGLRAFRAEDAPIFFGRESEVLEGTELLNQVVRQGHPRLVMVLGSSGSGKSSLVRAGIVPQLKLDRKQWTVVPPFRPGAAPMRELSIALSDAFGVAEAPLGWEEIYRWLEDDAEKTEAAVGAEATEVPTPAAARERLRQALEIIEGELSAAGEHLMNSVRDLRAYLDQQPEDALAGGVRLEANTLVDLGLRLRMAVRALEAPVVLVIDQFEELLGHDADHPATKFLSMLRAALDVETSPFLIIGTMRSDFLGLLQAAPPLQGLGRKSLSVGPMSREDMRQIIEEPAKLGQIELEKGLSDLLLDDTRTSDALPLLAFILRNMWDRYRGDRLLEIREYKELGGLQGAIALVAEETYQAALDRQADKTARDRVAREIRDAFLSMARPAAEGAGWSRNPVQWDQLSPTVQPLLEPFVDPQRLLVKRENGTVEVAHEALFRSWDTLSRWLDQNAEALHLLHEIQIEAAKWNCADQSSKCEYLWAGGRLARAQELRDGGVLALEDLDHSFVRASVRAERAAAEAEEARRQRELRRTRIFAGVVGAAFLVAVGLGLVTWNARNKAAEQAAVAQARTAVNLLASQPIHGLINAIEAADPKRIFSFTKRELHPEIQRALIATLQLARAGRMERTELRGHKSWAGDVGFHPQSDDARIVSADDYGVVLLWKLDGQQTGASFDGHKTKIEELAVSPDGAFITTVGPQGLLISDWDGKAVGEPLPGAALNDGETEFEAVAISPDSRIIAAGDNKGDIYLWDIKESGNQPAKFSARDAPRMDQEIAGLAFHPDGKWLASAGDRGSVKLWSRDGRLLTKFEGHTDFVNAVAFTPDGKYLLSASDDQTIRRWSLKPVANLDEHEDQNHGQVEDTVLFLGHDNQILSIAVSPDGELIASGGEDRTIRLWNIHGKSVAPPLLGHKGPIFAVNFSPDGKTLASASSDLTVRLWNLPPVATSHAGSVYGIAVTPDGSTIASSGAPSGVRLWDASLNPLKGSETFTDHDEWSGRVAFLQDGQTILSYGGDGQLLLSDRTGKKQGQVGPHGSDGQGLAIGPDGQVIASSGFDGELRVWNRQRKLPYKAVVEDGELNAVAISPDGPNGKLIAVAGDEGVIRFYTTEGEPFETIMPIKAHSEGINSLFFSRDGRYLVSGGRDRAIVVHDLTGAEDTVEIKGHDDVVSTAQFFMDGKFIVSGSEDTTVRIWRRDGTAVGVPFPEHTDWVLWLAVDDANKRVYTAGKEGTIRRWDLSYLDQSPDDWLAEACSLLASHSIDAEVSVKARGICTAHAVDARRPGATD